MQTGIPPRGISRKAAYPANCKREERWMFTEKFNSPHQLPSDFHHMDQFGHLIWDNEADSMIGGYDATPAELALLCQDDGWMETCHIDWVARKVNLQSRSTLCFVADTLLPGLLWKIMKDKAKGRLQSIKQLCVTVNVGMRGGRVFVGNGKNPGCHWAVVLVKLWEGNIIYCDSLGWQMPQELVSIINPLLQIFCKERRPWDVHIAHAPSTTGSPHACTSMCLNYPLQQCGSVCGIVAMVFMAVSALDEHLLQKILSPMTPQSAFFLNAPTVFSRFLRRQLIRWFVTGIVDIDFTSPSQSTQNADTAKVECKENKHNTGTSTNPGTANSEDTQLKHNTTPNPATKSTTDTQSDEHTYDKTNSESANFSAKSKKRKTTEKHDNDSPKTNHDSKDAGKSNSHNMPNSQPNIKKIKATTISNYAQQKTDTHNQPKCTTKPNVDTGHEHQSTCTQQTHQSNSTHNHENDNVQNSVKGGIGTGHNDRKSVRCPFCSKLLSARSKLVRHINLLHSGKDIRSTSTHPMNHHCNICNSFSTDTVQDLASHYRNAHEKNVNIKEAHFQSMDDFEKWKTQTEKETFSTFSKTRGAKTTARYTVHYFLCNRSGSICLKPHSERKRALKTQGTSKIDNNCTAFMRVFYSRHDGTVRVLFCTDHIGHELELAHLRLSKTMRDLIAARLKEGVEPRKLLNEIRNNMTAPNRDTLITVQDIHNIKKQYNIADIRKHVSDGTSTRLWVQQLSQDSATNPIIYYKAQGDESNTAGLNKDDVLLCIQTPFQREMMKKYAHKIVCIDSTHKTTQYEFLLTSLVIVDELQENVPVAWAISNSVTEQVLKVFFHAIKTANGEEDINTDIFMSDLAHNFYNAWCGVFSVPKKRLYCSWHVDRAWQQKVFLLIKDKEDQVEIYSYLRLVQSQSDQGKFHKQLQELLTVLKQKSNAFYNYFFNHYVDNNKYKLWAVCHRLGSIANTNMYAETFHRILKIVYFQSKQNRRVDILLHTLLQYARDTVFEQFIKSVKGKVTFRTREIRKRHKLAENIIPDTIVPDENHVDSEWLVPSSSTGVHYNISKVINDSNCQCKLKCSECSVCVCMFKCDCADFLTHKHITCKHIRAVKMKVNPSGTQVQNKNDQISENNVDYYAKFLLENTHANETDIFEDSKLLNNRLKTKIKELDDLINRTQSTAAKKAILQYLNSALMVGRGLEESEMNKEEQLEVKVKFPPNKNNETQRSKFYSTRRKPKKKKLSLNKPNSAQVETLTQQLSQVTPTTCAICRQEEDCGTSRNISWVMCSSCDVWIHILCDKQSESPDQDYVCHWCRQNIVRLQNRC